MSEKGTAKAEWSMTGVLGALAFFVGMILAIIAGWYRDEGGIVLALVIFGIIVGLFNITGREMIPFLVAAIALVVVGSINGFAMLDDVVDGFGRVLNAIVDHIAVFMTPAAIINAIRVVVALARPGG